jgi:hypothetical protein
MFYLHLYIHATIGYYMGYPPPPLTRPTMGEHKPTRANKSQRRTTRADSGWWVPTTGCQRGPTTDDSSQRRPTRDDNDDWRGVTSTYYRMRRPKRRDTSFGRQGMFLLLFFILLLVLLTFICVYRLIHAMIGYYMGYAPPPLTRGKQGRHVTYVCFFSLFYCFLLFTNLYMSSFIYHDKKRMTTTCHDVKPGRQDVR